LEGGPWLVYHMIVLVALAWWFGKAVTRP